MGGNSNVTNIVSNVFCDNSFNKITIVNSAVKVIEADAFYASHGSLTRLSLGGNAVTSFPFHQLPQMALLTYLNLRHNRLVGLPALSSATLEVLDLDNNADFSALAADTFVGLPRLSTLYFNANKINTILPGGTLH